MTVDLRLGRWQDALDGIECDAVIVDAPYSKRTHSGALDESDKADNAHRIGISYPWWTATEVNEFVGSWAPRTACWMVSITDHSLAPLWLDAYERAGLYAFAPVGIVIGGMGVRIMADGPASWTLYACVARQRRKMAGTAIWRSLPGGYTGGFPGCNAGGVSGGGRGKPPWLLDALVRDYSDPGHVVCDPCAGWGSTLIAARNAGRSAVGAEMDPAAHAAALANLSGDRTAFRRLVAAGKPPKVREGQADLFGSSSESRTERR